MPRVVLDANALMMPFQFGVNLHSELTRLIGRCEILVPVSVKSELRRLSSRNRAAMAGLRLSETFETYETSSEGDQAVIEAALALDAAVVTNDVALLAKLKKLGIKRIRLRSKNHLVVDGD